MSFATKMYIFCKLNNPLILLQHREFIFKHISDRQIKYVFVCLLSNWASLNICKKIFIEIEMNSREAVSILFEFYIFKIVNNEWINLKVNRKRVFKKKFSSFHKNLHHEKKKKQVLEFHNFRWWRNIFFPRKRMNG